jgi:hypothetical protein
MRRSSAYYRLIDRPGLWTAAMVAVALSPFWMIPFWGGTVHQALETFSGLSTIASQPDPKGSWLATIMLAAFLVGTQVASVSSRARRTLFGWTLPGLRRGLVTASFQIMAAGMVLTIALRGGISMRNLAAAGLAALFYSFGLAGATWMRGVWTSAAILWLIAPSVKDTLPAILRPGLVLNTVVSINPLLVALIATAAATWLVLRGLSPEFHRREIPDSSFSEQLGRLEGGSHKGSLFRRFVAWMIARRKLTFEAPAPIRPGSLSDWLRILNHTGYPAAGGWMRRLFKAALWTVAIGYTFNVPSLLVAMSLIGIVGRETSLLAGPYVYPLSRKMRATALYIVTLKAIAFVGVCGLMATALFAWTPWPHLGFGGPPLTPGQALLRTGVALALIPLLQWQASAPPLTYFWISAMRGLPGRNAGFLRLLVFGGLYLAATALYESYVGASRAALGAVAIVGAIVAGQLLLFALLRRAYRTRDLV